jgi:hypothetical protein
MAFQKFEGRELKHRPTRRVKSTSVYDADPSFRSTGSSSSPASPNARMLAATVRFAQEE